MSLLFLGGDTGNAGSPRLYRDGDDYLVQGYLVTEPELLAKLRIPPGETVVRVPESLWKYLPATPCMTRHSAGSSQSVPGSGHGRESNWQKAGHIPAEDQEPCASRLDQALWQREAVMEGAWLTGDSLSEYLWFDRAGVSLNIETGERDRWRLGHHEPARALPGYDLRVVTGRMLLSNRFTTDGKWARSEVIEDRALARRCSSAFEIVRGICPGSGPPRRARQ
jgi:hypothetical protein